MASRTWHLPNSVQGIWEMQTAERRVVLTVLSLLPWSRLFGWLAAVRNGEIPQLCRVCVHGASCIVSQLLASVSHS